jgi:hypothetical protein
MVKNALTNRVDSKQYPKMQISNPITIKSSSLPYNKPSGNDEYSITASHTGESFSGSTYDSEADQYHSSPEVSKTIIKNHNTSIQPLIGKPNTEFQAPEVKGGHEEVCGNTRSVLKEEVELNIEDIVEEFGHETTSYTNNSKEASTSPISDLLENTKGISDTDSFSISEISISKETDTPAESIEISLESVEATDEAFLQVLDKLNESLEIETPFKEVPLDNMADISSKPKGEILIFDDVDDFDD